MTVDLATHQDASKTFKKPSFAGQQQPKSVTIVDFKEERYLIFTLK